MFVYNLFKKYIQLNDLAYYQKTGKIMRSRRKRFGRIGSNGGRTTKVH